MSKITDNQILARACLIVERIENANYMFACDADREEAVEIVEQEIKKLLAKEKDTK